MKPEHPKLSTELIPIDVSNVSAYGSAWLQMNYFLELPANEPLVNHEPAAATETKSKSDVSIVHPFSNIWIITEILAFYVK